MPTQRERDLELALEHERSKTLERDKSKERVLIAKIGAFATIVAALASSGGWVAFANRQPPPVPEVTKIEADALDARMARIEGKIDKMAEGYTDLREEVRVGRARTEGKLEGIEQWASRRGYRADPIR